MVIGDKEHICEAGSAVYIPKNIPHTGRPLGAEPLFIIDVFAPPRADYLYFAQNQADWGEVHGVKADGHLNS
jgi:ribosomal protein L16 Arg81 hydroxylase